MGELCALDRPAGGANANLSEACWTRATGSSAPNYRCGSCPLCFDYRFHHATCRGCMLWIASIASIQKTGLHRKDAGFYVRSLLAQLSASSGQSALDFVAAVKCTARHTHNEFTILKTCSLTEHEESHDCCAPDHPHFHPCASKSYIRSCIGLSTAPSSTNAVRCIHNVPGAEN